MTQENNLDIICRKSRIVAVTGGALYIAGTASSLYAHEQGMSALRTHTEARLGRLPIHPQVIHYTGNVASITGLGLLLLGGYAHAMSSVIRKQK